MELVSEKQSKKELSKKADASPWIHPIVFYLKQKNQHFFTYHIIFLLLLAGTFFGIGVMTGMFGGKNYLSKK